jgi:hypothetical protein
MDASAQQLIDDYLAVRNYIYNNGVSSTHTADDAGLLKITRTAMLELGKSDMLFKATRALKKGDTITFGEPSWSVTGKLIGKCEPFKSYIKDNSNSNLAIPPEDGNINLTNLCKCAADIYSRMASVDEGNKNTLRYNSCIGTLIGNAMEIFNDNSGKALGNKLPSSRINLNHFCYAALILPMQLRISAISEMITKINSDLLHNDIANALDNICALFYKSCFIGKQDTNIVATVSDGSMLTFNVVTYELISKIASEYCRENHITLTRKGKDTTGIKQSYDSEILILDQ